MEGRGGMLYYREEGEEDKLVLSFSVTPSATPEERVFIFNYSSP
jgi:hypothetical protein